MLRRTVVAGVEPAHGLSQRTMAPESRQGMFVNLLERTSSLLGMTDRLVGIACGVAGLPAEICFEGRRKRNDGRARAPG